MPRPVAAAIACLAFAAVCLSAGTHPAMACSLALPRYQFVGEALAKSRGGVTYRVDSVSTNKHSTQVTVPRRGGTVDVLYVRDGSKFIDVGKRYRVAVWRVPEGGVTSGVETAQHYCGGGGTTYADGSRIDTGIRLLGVRPRIAGALAAAAFVVPASAAAVRHRARRRRGAVSPPVAG